MKTYRVEAMEKFVVQTVYNVKANSPEEAEALCKAGKVAYDQHSIEEGDDEWIETLSVEEDSDQ